MSACLAIFVKNVADECLHTLLDLLTPWITHADSLWNDAKRMHCPPRAAFVCDDFTQATVAAMSPVEASTFGVHSWI